VEGVRRDDGRPVGQRWEHIEVTAGAGPVVRTDRIGDFGVDWARLVLADADALSSWRRDQTPDGLA
jgi:hypothetical protein